MSCIGFDVIALLQEVTQVHCSSEGAMSVEAILSKYSDVFKGELGILKGIEASINVEQGAIPKFHQHHPVPFAVKEKVEAALKSQVEEGELIPIA